MRLFKFGKKRREFPGFKQIYKKMSPNFTGNNIFDIQNSLFLKFLKNAHRKIILFKFAKKSRNCLRFNKIFKKPKIFQERDIFYFLKFTFFSKKNTQICLLKLHHQKPPKHPQIGYITKYE
jgi:hypothetical protein